MSFSERGTISSFELIERFETSPRGDRTEDLVVDTPHYIGIFDGVTGVKDWSRDGRSMGQWAAYLAGEALRELKADASIADFAALATQKLAEARLRFGLVAADRLATSSIVLPKRKPLEVWSIGDSHYGFTLKDGSWHPHAQHKLYDEVTGNYRAIIVSQEILEQGAPQTAEARAAVARRAWESLVPAIGKQMLWANHPDPAEKLGFGVLNGTPVPAHGQLVHHLPADVAEIVLCSDGFPVPTATAAAGVAEIRKLRESDPFLARDFLSAKGFVQMDGSVADWFDDVSYVRVAA